MIFYEVKYVTEDIASQVLMNSLPELGSKKSENAQLLNANLYEEVSVLTQQLMKIPSYLYLRLIYGIRERLSF